MGFDAVDVAGRVHVFSADTVDGVGGLVTRNKGTYTYFFLYLDVFSPSSYYSIALTYSV